MGYEPEQQQLGMCRYPRNHDSSVVGFSLGREVASKAAASAKGFDSPRRRYPLADDELAVDKWR